MTGAPLRFLLLVGAVGVIACSRAVTAAEAEKAAHHTLRFTGSGGYPLEIRAMRFSPDGSMLAVSVVNKGLSFIRTQDGETAAERKGSPLCIGYSRDGSRI